MEKIFKWMTAYADVPDVSSNVAWFVRALNEREFRGTELVLFCFLKFCSELRVIPKRENLASYIRTDLAKDVKRYNIKLDAMTSYDYTQVSQFNEAVKILGEMAQSTFELYVSENLEGREFQTDVNEYFNSRQNEQIQDAFMEYYPKLSDGSDPVIVSDEFRSRLHGISEVYDRKKIKELGDSQVVGMSDDEEEDFEYICDTGVPCIDGDCGGIYTHLMTTINAQPGGGKTRFTLCYYAYPVLTQAKKDVYFLETELTKSQVMNILIAHHIVQLYGGEIKIPDSIMNRKREMTEEQKQIYRAAKYDLFKSGKYGKFYFNGKVILEELEEDLKAKIRSNPNLKLICIDYMGFIKSVPRNKFDKSKSQWEIITDAYDIVRDILMNFNVHACCINQYNDDGIAAAEAGKPIRSGMTQGGHIVFRHTDYDINITFTNEQKLAKVRMVGVGKTRGTPGFNNVLFKVDMAVSLFRQQ